jgi:DNA repair protein RadA/Sms
MVDCVLNFEGDKFKTHRILRGIKNRFGPTCEVGVFNMENDGLKEVLNPSEMFLSEKGSASEGSTVIATVEGTRTLLLEVQALVGATPYPSPRRVARGVEYNRLLQILAVLEKRVGLNLSKQDVYINVIGGIEIIEPAADLGIAIAVLTCARSVSADAHTVIIGEIGLSGEIRAVENIEKRLKEAQKLGFKRAITPKIPPATAERLKGLDIEVIQVSRLVDAISKCVGAKANF